MQLTHDITFIQEGFAGFAQLSRSLNDRVEAAEACIEVAKELLKVAEEQEPKHWEEWASCTTIRELEAWVAKEISAKRLVYATKLEERLDNTGTIL